MKTGGMLCWIGLHRRKWQYMGSGVHISACRRCGRRWRHVDWQMALIEDYEQRHPQIPPAEERSDTTSPKP